MSQAVENLFKDYGRFDDGWLLSFEYFYTQDEKSLPAQPLSAPPLSARMVLYARNHAEEWGKVKVVVEDVQELCAKVSGNCISRIICGAKLLKFGNLWCVEVNGCYEADEGPSSLEELREIGDCYVLGKSITAYRL